MYVLAVWRARFRFQAYSNQYRCKEVLFTRQVFQYKRYCLPGCVDQRGKKKKLTESDQSKILTKTIVYELDC